MSRILGVIGALALLASSVSAATLVHAGRVIDGVSDSVRSGVTIVVEDDRIVGIESGYRLAAPGDEVLDLREATLLPGLMDMHTHLSMEFSAKSEELPREISAQHDGLRVPLGSLCGANARSRLHNCSRPR